MKARSIFSTALVAMAVMLTGCASTQSRNPADPFESFNRSVFRFNDAVDEAVLRPVATVYRNNLPLMVRTGVNNFFGNLGDVWNFANSVLQFRLQASADNFMRVNVNTFFGLGGLLDIATEAGIDRHNEDFGQTLGRWGVPSGPYLVIPLLGPSTVRDASALPVDRFGDPLLYLDNGLVQGSLYVTRVIDARSNFLRAGQLLDDAALDKYSFTRDAYLQRRLNDVYDGNPPGKRPMIRGGNLLASSGSQSKERRPQIMKVESMIQTLQRRGFARFMFASVLLAGAAIGYMQPAHAADEAPDALVKRLSSDVLDTIKSDTSIKSGDIAKIMVLVDSKIMPNVDFQRMTASAVGPAWRQATPDQKTRLQNEFKTLLVRSYAGALDQVSDQSVAVRPYRGSPDDKEVLIRTEVRGQGDPVQLDYRLVKTPGEGAGWKVYNINVLGVWLVDTYRSQFSEEINSKGIDGLIAALAARNKSNASNGKR